MTCNSSRHVNVADLSSRLTSPWSGKVVSARTSGTAAVDLVTSASWDFFTSTGFDAVAVLFPIVSPTLPTIWAFFPSFEALSPANGNPRFLRRLLWKQQLVSKQLIKFIKITSYFKLFPATFWNLIYSTITRHYLLSTNFICYVAQCSCYSVKWIWNINIKRSIE